MTVFNNDLDTARPAGSDDPAEADDNMRRIQAAVQERENVNHYWPLTGTEVSDADSGEHRNILFHAPIAATPTVAADHGDLRIKDVANGADTKAELVYTDEAEQEVQLSSDGDNLANDTYLTGNNAAGSGSVNLIKAGTNDLATLPDSAEMASNAAPVEDEAIANKKYVDDVTTSGASVMHDAEGGFQNADVNGTKTKVYTKYFTGTLDADSQTSVAHGITGIDNILAVSAAAFDDSGSSYGVVDYLRGASAANAWNVFYDGTNVTFDNVGANVQGNNYRIRIDYKL